MRPELTERAFRRWEDQIRIAVDGFPAAYQFEPAGMAVTTAVSRIRDAVRSLRLYNWPTVIDMEKFKKFGCEVRNINNTFVELAPVPEFKATRQMYFNPNVRVHGALLTEDVVKALCVLAANGVLSPKLVSLTQSQEEQFRQIVTDCGLEFRQSDEGFVIV